MKQQSKQWEYPSSPSKMFKAAKSTRKVLVSVFWDFKGVIVVDYLPKRQVIKAIIELKYCNNCG